MANIVASVVEHKASIGIRLTKLIALSQIAPNAVLNFGQLDPDVLFMLKRSELYRPEMMHLKIYSLDFSGIDLSAFEVQVIHVKTVHELC